MPATVLPLIGAGRAEAEADQAATAEMAVAVDLDSLETLGVPKARVDAERRGDSKVDRLSQVDRRALHSKAQHSTHAEKKRREIIRENQGGTTNRTRQESVTCEGKGGQSTRSGPKVNVAAGGERTQTANIEIKIYKKNRQNAGRC